jgi:hypothetical protein
MAAHTTEHLHYKVTVHCWEKPVLWEAVSCTLKQRIHLERIQDVFFHSNEGNLLSAQK